MHWLATQVSPPEQLPQLLDPHVFVIVPHELPPQTGGAHVHWLFTQLSVPGHPHT